jgi:tetratricopeptide (TPR) repeat protein
MTIPACGIADFEKARAVREQLVRTRPGVLEFELDLAYTYRKLGEARRYLDQPAKALPFYEDARPILEKLSRESPTMIDFQHKLAACYSGLAHTSWATEPSAKAALLYLRAAVIVQAILLTTPESALIRHDLALMHHYAGQVYFDLGQFDESERLLRSAGEVWAKLVREPAATPVFQRLFADNCDALGELRAHGWRL